MGSSTIRLFLVVLACAVSLGVAQRLPRPVRVHVSDRTESACMLTWSNPPGMQYSKFDIYIHPPAFVEYPVERDQPLAYISDMQPGVTYSVRLKGKTLTKRSSSPTSFNLWSEPTAPTGLVVKPLDDLRLKISLGSESQDFTAKIVGAQIEWTPVKLDNALLGYETEIFPDEGTIVYPDDMDRKDSVLIYTSLTPGKEYTITLRTKIGPPYAPVYSQSISSTFIMPPQSPYDVKVHAIGGSYITFASLSLMGVSEGVEFDIEPPHGKVGDPIEDPVTSAYKLYTITKLMPETTYVIKAYSISHGIRSTEPFTVHITTEPAGKMDVGVNDFSGSTVTLGIKEKKKLEEGTQEYVIQYNNVDDPESFIETEAFFGDSSTSIINVKITGLNPGMTYRFGVVRSPSSEFPEYVGEVVQTTIPEVPILVSNKRYEDGISVVYGEPDEGNCPMLKVYSSPGSEKYNFRVISNMFPIGEPIYLPGVPTDRRYTVHARCVSSGVEGDETVFDSFTPKMDEGEKNQPKLACQEFKEILTNSDSTESSSKPSSNSTVKANACCGIRPYVKEQDSCCGDSLLRINSEPRKLCCGTYPYIVAHWVCCEGNQLVPRSIGCDR